MLSLRQISALLALAVAVQAAMGFAPGLCFSGDSVCHMFSYSIVRANCTVSGETPTCSPRRSCGHRNDRGDRATKQDCDSLCSAKNEQACNDLPVAWAVLLDGSDTTIHRSPALALPLEAARSTDRPPCANQPVDRSRGDPLPPRTAPSWLQIFLV